MRKRNRQYKMWIDEKEYNILCSKSKRAGIKRSEFIRKLITDKEIKEVNLEEIETNKNIYFELNKIGNNINQIARAFNSNMGTQENILYLKDLMKDIVMLFEGR